MQAGVAGALAEHGLPVHGVCAAEPHRAARVRAPVCGDLPPGRPGKEVIPALG